MQEDPGPAAHTSLPADAALVLMAGQEVWATPGRRAEPRHGTGASPGLCLPRGFEWKTDPVSVKL